MTLNRMIFALVNSGFVTEFSVVDTNRGTLNISHLFFVDDTLIFARPNKTILGH